MAIITAVLVQVQSRAPLLSMRNAIVAFFSMLIRFGFGFFVCGFQIMYVIMNSNKSRGGK